MGLFSCLSKNKELQAGKKKFLFRLNLASIMDRTHHFQIHREQLLNMVLTQTSIKHKITHQCLALNYFPQMYPVCFLLSLSMMSDVAIYASAEAAQFCQLSPFSIRNSCDLTPLSPRPLLPN